MTITTMQQAPKPLKSIAKLKKRNAKTAIQLQQAVQPLNDRLIAMNMHVWWEGDDYFINAEAANRSIGSVFYLDDHSLAELMAMTDRKLETFLKGF